MRRLPDAATLGRNAYWDEDEVWQLEVLMMARKIVILGGGTGGTLMANRLRKLYDRGEMEIAVVAIA